MQIFRRAKFCSIGFTLEKFLLPASFCHTAVSCTVWHLEINTIAYERFLSLFKMRMTSGLCSGMHFTEFVTLTSLPAGMVYKCGLITGHNTPTQSSTLYHTRLILVTCWANTKLIRDLALTVVPITIPRQGTWNPLCWAETQWQRVAHCSGSSTRKEPQAHGGWWCGWG